MTRPLCLLALDGGGVRGLSSLYILKHFMEQLNPGGPPIKPCDFFDLIGGTSTGGLIAIMLGRLKMDIDDCIREYGLVSAKVFTRTKRFPISLKGKVRGVYDSSALQETVKDIVRRFDVSNDDTALLRNEDPSGCRIFVCATTEANETACLRSYACGWGDSTLLNETAIWEAARATSAATSFFDPIQIGPHKESFVDGALGANNPIKQVWREAVKLWGAERLDSDHVSILSVGTGQPKKRGLGTSAAGIGKAILDIALNTDRVARDFIADHDELQRKGRYVRFNAPGLEEVGLEEYQKRSIIMSRTKFYLHDPVVQADMEAFIERSTNSQIFAREKKVKPLPIPSYIPRSSTDDFVTRSTITDALAGAFSATNGVEESALVLLHGLPGSGKTQLARHYGETRMAAGQPVWWVDASSRSTVAQSFQGLALKAQLFQDLTEVQTEDGDISALVLKYLEHSGLCWLLIFDNYGDIEEGSFFELALSVRRPLLHTSS